METHAYPQCYVNDAATSLGVALDYAVYNCGITPNHFALLFVQSGMADLFGSGNPAVISGMSGTELARSILSFVYGTTEWPMRTVADGLSAEYWAGWALAQYQWYSARRFEDIFSVASLEEIVELYPLHHEMDISRFYTTMEGYFEEGKGVAKRLKEIRQARGLSQQELAASTGVKVRNIQMYEQGHNNINHATGITLYRLAHVLGCW